MWHNSFKRNTPERYLMQKHTLPLDPTPRQRDFYLLHFLGELIADPSKMADFMRGNRTEKQKANLVQNRKPARVTPAEAEETRAAFSSMPRETLSDMRRTIGNLSRALPPILAEGSANLYADGTSECVACGVSCLGDLCAACAKEFAE